MGIRDPHRVMSIPSRLLLRLCFSHVEGVGLYAGHEKVLMAFVVLPGGGYSEIYGAGNRPPAGWTLLAENRRSRVIANAHREGTLLATITV